MSNLFHPSYSAFSPHHLRHSPLLGPRCSDVPPQPQIVVAAVVYVTTAAALPVSHADQLASRGERVRYNLPGRRSKC
jgi:hypothetical protein